MHSQETGAPPVIETETRATPTLVFQMKALISFLQIGDSAVLSLCVSNVWSVSDCRVVRQPSALASRLRNNNQLPQRYCAQKSQLSVTRLLMCCCVSEFRTWTSCRGRKCNVSPRSPSTPSALQFDRLTNDMCWRVQSLCHHADSSRDHRSSHSAGPTSDLSAVV